MPTDKGWLKNVVTAGGDINALKKNHYQAIFPNDKKSAKDVLQKTTQNTAKETAGEFAENKAVNLTKDKIAKETKKEIVEKVKDKAIDVTENKVVNAAKSEIKDEAKDKIVKEVKDKTEGETKHKTEVTIKEVVREDSKRAGDSVHTSPAVTETKLDKVTSTGTKYEVAEPKGGDKPPKIKTVSANAKEFERLYNEGKINILDFVNECRQIDDVLDAEFLEKVEKMRNLIPGKIRSKGNFGYATVEIDGLEKTEFFAHSKIHTLDNREKFKEDVVKRLEDISLQSKKQEFETLEVNGENIINGEKNMIE